jgi:hypothetical protein
MNEEDLKKELTDPMDRFQEHITKAINEGLELGTSPVTMMVCLISSFCMIAARTGLTDDEFDLWVQSMKHRFKRWKEEK